MPLKRERAKLERERVNKDHKDCWVSCLSKRWAYFLVSWGIWYSHSTANHRRPRNDKKRGGTTIKSDWAEWRERGNLGSIFGCLLLKAMIESRGETNGNHSSSSFSLISRWHSPHIFRSTKRVLPAHFRYISTPNNGIIRLDTRGIMGFICPEGVLMLPESCVKPNDPEGYGEIITLLYGNGQNQPCHVMMTSFVFLPPLLCLPIVKFANGQARPSNWIL